ncbi:MAG TPA: hypothetical protein H9695_11775 [Candidatus Mediterraneibacter excrementigallinarum]|nr:hypothetical protein [Candidatus Mediterraneibacter excrementigallinarum]
MDKKDNKELALEAAIEFTKSWNSASNTVAMKTTDFVDTLNLIYDAICKLDER